jgi:hypothetical protein
MILTFFFVLSGLVFADIPFGVTPNPWDVEMTELNLVTMLRQVQAVNMNQSYTVVIQHSPYGGRRVRDALIKVGCKTVHPFYWYKNNQNIEGFNNYVYAVESLTIGFFGAGPGRHFDMSDNPLERHNIIAGPTVRTYWKNSAGKIINSTQNQSGLCRALSSRHCPPDQKCLILGSGSGCDVAGCLQSGFSVVGVEKDPDQFLASCQHLVGAVEAQNDDEELKDCQYLCYEEEVGETARYMQNFDSKGGLTYVDAAYRGVRCAACGKSFKEKDDEIDCNAEGCSNVVHELCVTVFGEDEIRMCGYTNCKKVIEKGKAQSSEVSDDKEKAELAPDPKKVEKVAEIAPESEE